MPRAIDFLCSAGVLVGTLCAAGLPAAEIERAAFSLQPWDLVRWAPGSGQRLTATGLADWVHRAVDGPALQALLTPVMCAVQRLRDGAVLGFNRGHAGLAVQASGAIEDQFTLVTIRGEAFADADQRMPLPVRLARASGATRLLAVDAPAYEDRAPGGGRSAIATATCASARSPHPTPTWPMCCCTPTSATG